MEMRAQLTADRLRGTASCKRAKRLQVNALVNIIYIYIIYIIHIYTYYCASLLIFAQPVLPGPA